MQEEDFDKELKVLVVGNGGVGKTSMIRRFCKGIFTDEYKKTIGVDFLEKNLYVDALGQEVRFMLWDTAGQDEFDSIVRTYFRGAGGAVLAFSTTDRASFDAIRKWKKRVEAECGDIALALVQNKVDLVDQAVASADEVEGLARELGLRLYRTCVKENMNVAEVFVYLAEHHQRKLAAGQLGRPVDEDAGAAGASGLAAGGNAQQAAQPQDQPPPPPPPNANNHTFGTEETDYDRQMRARTVELAPSKKRTGGKKSLKDKFTACSLL